MKTVKKDTQIDAVAEDTDAVEFEIMRQPADKSFTIYIHVNGVTVLRIGKLQKDQIKQSNDFTLNILEGVGDVG